MQFIAMLSAIASALPSIFTFRGCLSRGFPSSGGVLTKEAEVVDMIYLSLPRNHTVKRSQDAAEEDEFCSRLRKLGATWWEYEEYRSEVVDGTMSPTKAEMTGLVFGWPAEGNGVWVLRWLKRHGERRDFGKLGMAISLEERIAVMKDFGAEYVEDASRVEELQDGYPPRDQIPERHYRVLYSRLVD